MPPSAPLRVAVEIELRTGPAAGERRFRLTRAATLPATLVFAGRLPMAADARGEVAFALPDGERIRAAALLRADPEAPEGGFTAELVGLDEAGRAALREYVYLRKLS